MEESLKSMKDEPHEEGFRQVESNAKQAVNKRRFYEHRYREALKGLSSILNSGNSDTGIPIDADPLFAACFAVGKAVGITIVRPPNEIRSPHEDSLQTIARFSGFRLRRVTLREGDRWWLNDSGPLLAYFGTDEKPVALLPDGNGRYSLFEPVSHEVRLVEESVASGIFGVHAWMFYRPFPSEPLTGKTILHFGLRGSGKDIVMLLLFGVVGSLIGLLTPVLTGMLFGTVIPQSSRSQLFQIVFILVAGVIATSGFDLARQVAVMRLQNRVDTLVQPAIMDRLLNLPVGFFKKYSSGDLAKRVLGATQLRDIVSGSVINVFLGFLFGFSNILLLFIYSWKLAIITLAMITLLACIGIWISILRIRLNRENATVQGKISGLLGNLLTGIAKIRITGTEKPAFAMWAEMFGKERFISYREGMLENSMAVVTTVFPIVALAIIIVSVGVFLTGDNLDSGSFIAFTTAFTNFQTTLLQTVTTVISCSPVIPLYERIKPVLASIPEATAQQSYPGRLRGSVEVQNLNFSYSKDDPQILFDVDFVAPPGEFVAIVGGSGSGKSTLLRLLLGFEIPDSGTVFFDGVDLHTLNIQGVRQQIGVVMQNGQLQPGFILNTIIGSSPLSVEHAWDAARMAGIDEDIRKMPMGMYTAISEGGETISGGQKQRLLIASALVRKPSIIFFDEATSALDNRTQEIVSRSLEQLKATRIVIAHRLSTIRNADRIYCLDHGRIVQQGTYDELVAKEGFFKELANRQIA